MSKSISFCRCRRVAKASLLAPAELEPEAAGDLRFASLRASKLYLVAKAS